MSKMDEITHNNLPEAVRHILMDVQEIKKLLLNKSVSQRPDAEHNNGENDILSVADVAKKLGLEKGTVYNLTHKRQIPYFKRGGRIYFDKNEINDRIRTDRRKTVQELQNETNQW